MTTLSVCLIVKNEAQNLPRCLRSVQGVVDEMLVVDTGSTDDTCRIAESLGARLAHFPWQNDFSAARNYALQQATGDWILSLDADEELEAGSRERLRGLISSREADGYLLTVRNLQPPGELTSWLDLQILRLFRRLPGVVFEGVVHEQVTPSLLRSGAKIKAADVILLHYGYQQKDAQGQSRAERNLELIQQSLKSAPEDAYLHYQLGATLKSLNRNEEARLALEKSVTHADSLSPEVLAQARMKLAQIYLAADAHDAVMVHAAACLQIEPQNIPALYAAALASYSQGKMQDAYRYFEKITGQPGISSDDLANIQQVMAAIRRDIKI